MNIAVRYYTRKGNTRKLAQSIAEAVGVEAYDVSVPLAEKVDVLFLGSSVYAGNPDDAVKAFIRSNAANIGMIANFSTAAMAKSTYEKIKEEAEANGIVMCKEEFRCYGSFTILHRKHPDDKDLQNAAEFAKTVVKKL